MDFFLQTDFDSVMQLCYISYMYTEFVLLLLLMMMMKSNVSSIEQLSARSCTTDYKIKQ